MTSPTARLWKARLDSWRAHLGSFNPLAFLMGVTGRCPHRYVDVKHIKLVNLHGDYVGDKYIQRCHECGKYRKFDL